MFVKALRISWIKWLTTSDGLWQRLANNFMPVDNTSLDLESLLVLSENMKNKFWREVVTAWGEYKTVVEHAGLFLGYTFLFSTYTLQKYRISDLKLKCKTLKGYAIKHIISCCLYMTQCVQHYKGEQMGNCLNTSLTFRRLGRWFH